MSTKSSTSRSAAAIEPSRAAADVADAPLTALGGIGPKVARAIEAFGVRTVFDLLCTLPRGIADLRAPLAGEAILAHARASRAEVAIRGTVERTSIVPLRGRRAVRVALRSDGVLVELWWFFVSPAARALSGEVVVIGAPTIHPRRTHVARVVHPRTARDARIGTIEPLYALRGVPSARIAAALRPVASAFAPPHADALDPLPSELREGATFDVLLRETHAPTAPDAHLAAKEALRARLAFAEAAWLALRRIERDRAASRVRAPRLPRDAAVERRLLDALGFDLTASQRRAIESVAARLALEVPSRTLLTGDVGTGKTAVLLAAVAQAVAAKTQVAILAPTVVLADQYRAALDPVVRATSAKVASFDDAAIEPLARGEIDVAVGTHALTSEAVRFSRLGLVIVDEQHRLGVGQRLALLAKGAPHLISVSATPIPRSLALALRGEIESTHLDQRPEGRETPATERVPLSQVDRARAALVAAVERGERAFVVCASIDDEERGAIARASELRKQLGKSAVALVHGELEPEAQRRAIFAFRSGRAKVLVGTSLLEVGLDVPEATLMIVDGADRFGLAQLHQLRGRVGRGARRGRCLLVHDDVLGEAAQARLDALVRARDGLEVARADLALRGAGDPDGKRQSGEAAGLSWLDPFADEALARAAVEWVAREGVEGVSRTPGLARVLDRLDRAAMLLPFAREDAG